MRRSRTAWVLKWAGTWAIVLLIAFDAAAGWARVQGGSRVFWSWESLYFGGIPPWLPVAMLAVPTIVLWWKDRPRHLGPVHCPKCGYDLRGAAGPRCSECGELIAGARG